MPKARIARSPLDFRVNGSSCRTQAWSGVGPFGQCDRLAFPMPSWCDRMGVIFETAMSICRAKHAARFDGPWPSGQARGDFGRQLSDSSAWK